MAVTHGEIIGWVRIPRPAQTEMGGKPQINHHQGAST